MAPKRLHRRLPAGAEVQAGGGVHFRVWAPRRKRVAVRLEADPGAQNQDSPTVIELKPEADGYYSVLVPEAGAGAFYRYLLDDNPFPFPDPASRFQPFGPEGPSEVIDPGTYSWNDGEWPGVSLPGQVIYEMHVGTFTRPGNWDGAAGELAELAALGITVIEVMPVSDFPGRFGWGYDGVNLFAPTRLYGRPDDFRRFVDAAHAAGIGVILDVVYNHLGPANNYLKEFSPKYFTDQYQTEWGEPINFDGPDSGPVRDFFISNAEYWIEEFHLDGLRLDATQNIYDSSAEHILAAITRRVRKAAGARSTLIVGENEPQDVALLRPIEDGGCGLDALWNDDFHHTAMVALTGHNEAYYSDYLGTPQEFISSVKRGFLYQGQGYLWQGKRRGTPTGGMSPAAFITFIQNHDQVANSYRGDRIHKLTSEGCVKALTTLLLLAPATPMLFQGQEFAASTPFLYFADHDDALAGMIFKGRVAFLHQFRSLSCAEVNFSHTDPANPETFMRSKLDFNDRERHAETYAMHRELLRLRREDPVFSQQREGMIDGAVLGPEAFVLRWFGAADGDRMMVVNLGRDLHYSPAPEPLLAAPAGCRWKLMWSTEDLLYGGCGTPQPEAEGEGWRFPGHAAVVLKSA